MVSFDVKTLFTMVPIDDSLTIIRDRLLADKELKKRTNLFVTVIFHLTELCLRSMYFTYNNNYIEQKDGMSQTSSCKILNKQLTTANHRPKLWVRYIDDTFVLWQHGDDHLEELFQYLNTEQKPTPTHR